MKVNRNREYSNLLLPDFETICIGFMHPKNCKLVEICAGIKDDFRELAAEAIAAKTIEKCGGVFEKQIIHEETPIFHYWIEL